jgi:hypothetical protein
MRKTAEPTTLYERALAIAERDYRERLDELKKLKPKLPELDVIDVDLKAMGISIWPALTRWRSADKCVEISPSYFMNKDTTQKLMEALLDRGFKKVEHRKVTSSWSYAILQRGRLRVGLSDLPPLAEEAKPAASSSKQRPA